MSRIAALVLLIWCQSCGGSQEYVSTPDLVEDGLRDEIFRDSNQPVGRTPSQMGPTRSTIQESDTVLKVACADGIRQLLDGNVRTSFESTYPGNQIRLFDHRVELGLQELVLGNLDLMLTTKPLSYSQKRQGLRQQTCYRKTGVPNANSKNPPVDVYVTYRVDCKGATMQLKDFLARFPANFTTLAGPTR